MREDIVLDLKKMKDIVDEVLSYSQNVPKPLATEELIQKWYENKKRFIDLMYGKLIWETAQDVTFEIPEANRKGMVSDLAERFDNAYGNGPLADFVFETRADFFNNILSTHYRVNEDLIIPKGSKIIKAFKYFEPDKEKLVAMQNEASLLVQNAKITGKFCISVHPLDYLSSSENQYNWRSCHALDGEYRAGNLSYICDDVTVVCYLKGEKNTQLPNFPSTVPWNNKKWRMLAFIGKDSELVFAGRQYPFQSEFAMNTARSFLRYSGLCKGEYSGWTDSLVSEINGRWLFDKYLFINGAMYKEKNIIKDARDSRHFNDLLESSYYNPMCMWRQTYTEVDYEPLIVGSRVMCIKCGCDTTVDSETMLCDDCYDEYSDDDEEERCRCGECGFLEWIEDMIYIQDRNEYLCSDCVVDTAKFCDRCNCFYSKDKVYYDEKLGMDLCERCRESDIPSDISDKDFF